MGRLFLYVLVWCFLSNEALYNFSVSVHKEAVHTCPCIPIGTHFSFIFLNKRWKSWSVFFLIYRVFYIELLFPLQPYSFQSNGWITEVEAFKIFSVWGSITGCLWASIILFLQKHIMKIFYFLLSKDKILEISMLY